MKTREDWQLEITGLIMGFGKYREAAKRATKQGVDGVIYAMQAAHADGYNQALKDITRAALRRSEERANRGGEAS